MIARAGELLAIAPAMVINEYGMTELCSQLYDATPFNCRDIEGDPERDTRFRRRGCGVTARDPVTLRPMADGEIGMLTFFDLANVGSVSAVMTEDLGIVERRAGARARSGAAGGPRGCALAIGAILGESSGGGVAMSRRQRRSGAISQMRVARRAGRDADRAASALARAFARWRDRNYRARRDAIAANRAFGRVFSSLLLENSIDALLKPFTCRRD